MPSDAKVSIFTDNDLTYIMDDYFEINLVARLLNQIYVVPVLPPGYDYDNLHANVMDEMTPSSCNNFCTSFFIHSMNMYSIFTKFSNMTLYTFIKLYLSVSPIYLMHY